MSFYLKHRPDKFDQLDLEAVRSELLTIFKSKRIPHAFLFAGPKGTGKTSAARIVAKAVNCLKRKKGQAEPCNRCENCKLINENKSMDILEIDAASNRGIDDVRILRDRIKLAPSKLNKKVYIIDEVHMLTTEAFNAMLKTLEEPPEHALFVLCTTEKAKLPATIVSRCNSVSFVKANEAELLRALKRVVKQEKIKISDLGLKKISKTSDGSFRDGVKVLEQLSLSSKKISEKRVDELVKTSFSETRLDEWLEWVINKQAKKAMDWLEMAWKNGVRPKQLLIEAIGKLRQLIVNNIETEQPVEELIELIGLFLDAGRELKGAVVESLPVELAILKWCQKNEETEGVVEKVVIKSKAMSKTSGKLKISEVKQKWSNVLEEIKPINHSLEALLRATEPSGFENNKLMVKVFYKFHKDRLEEERYRNMVEETIAKVLVAPVKISFFLASKDRLIDKKNDDNLKPVNQEDIIKTAEEVFGVEVGGED